MTANVQQNKKNTIMSWLECKFCLETVDTASTPQKMAFWLI